MKTTLCRMVKLALEEINTTYVMLLIAKEEGRKEEATRREEELWKSKELLQETVNLISKTCHDFDAASFPLSHLTTVYYSTSAARIYFNGIEYDLDGYITEDD